MLLTYKRLLLIIIGESQILINTKGYSR